MSGRFAVIGLSVSCLLVNLLLAAPPEEIPGRRIPPTLPMTVSYPPELPDGKTFVTATSELFLEGPATQQLRAGVEVAKTPPTVDFLYYPGQTYAGNPWSNWGDSSFAAGKYYSAIGDHLAPQGNAFVFEYDPAKKALRQIADVRKIINLPAGHYTPGKIHSHVELGSDGWLYFSTHRGSTKVTTDANHYLGDWILRANPKTGETEVIAHGPVPKHCIPNGVLDPERLIFYGGTAPGVGGENEGIMFFAYDLKQKKVLFSGPDGPGRAMILAKSTGNIYYTPAMSSSPLMRFDPASGQPPEKLAGEIGIRAATEETPQNIVYTVSQGKKGNETTLYAFNTKTEIVTALGPAAVGVNEYVASLKADPTGRYLYYVPGAHGGADVDNSAVVQFDTKTKKRKVIAFLKPYFEHHLACIPRGTYGIAIDDKGEALYITWNISRGPKNWDCCGLAVVHIPKEERQ
ncbi:MAG: hypothetical protein ACKVP0_24280 [Pirellulaceae bacterium]